MDLIILALIAGFIIYRLYTTLGENTGYKPDKSKKTSNVVDFKGKNVEGRASKTPVAPADIENIPAKFRMAVQKLTKVDPRFSLKEFTEGATVAFEMVLEAYDNGELETLKNLLAPDLYKAFKAAVEERQAQGHTLENTLVRVEEVLVEAMTVTGNNVQIRVRFTTEQVPVLRDKDGEVIEGNPNQIDQVIDTWTFEKALRTTSLNWTLISTEK